MFDSHKSGAGRPQARARPAPAWRWLPHLGLALGAGVAALTGFLTLTPVEVPEEAGFVGIDKVFHFIAFASLVFPVIATAPRRWVWVAPLAIAFGGAIELIQPHVNRTDSWGDFFANTAGVMVGVWLGRRAYARLLAWFPPTR